MLLAALFILHTGTHACINLEYTPDSLPRINLAFGPLLTYDSIPQPALYDRKKELEQFLADAEHFGPHQFKPGTGNSPEQQLFQLNNDLAVVYLLLGDAHTAHDILIGMENEMPGKYSVAANLGTAYELLGKTDSALHWIQKAVNIDPKSHEGSEWIHVMLLRYKQARELNPEYVAASAIMLDFGDKNLPENAYQMNVEELKKQLAWQLHERLALVKAPDELVGMLLFDYANLLALSDQLEEAAWYYQAAKDYGYDSDLLSARLKKMQEMLGEGKTSAEGEEAEVVAPPKQVNIYLIAGIIALLAVFGVWFLLTREKKER